MADTKYCAGCGENKPYKQFHKRSNTKCGVQSRCRLCVQASHAARYASDSVRKERIKVTGQQWSSTNSIRRRLMTMRHNARRGGYAGPNFSTEDVKAQLEKQDGDCPCGKPLGDSWHIDHDHATGQLRALMHGNCNRAIGMLHEDYCSIKNLAEWLKKSNDATQALDS